MKNDYFSSTEIGEISASSPVRLVINELNGANTWITDIKGNLSPNFQILYSLGSRAFINVFNDRLGVFTLEGINITSACENSDSEIPPFMAFYRAIKITNKRTPIQMSFNKIVLSGWATSMDIGNYSKDNVEGNTFKIDFIGRIQEFNNGRN
jgi:hypothetical protein